MNKELEVIANKIEALDMELTGFILEYACAGLYWGYFGDDMWGDPDTTIRECVMSLNLNSAEALLTELEHLKALSDKKDLNS